MADTVASLWPDSEVEFLHRVGASPNRTFLVVPHTRSPRLLLPVKRRPAGAALARFPQALSRSQAAARAGTVRLFRAGAGYLSPGRLTIHGGDNGIDTYLSQVLDQPVEVSLSIGTARINRKPVLGVFSPAGEPLGYAKVGVTPYTSNLVSSEAGALSELGRQDWSTFRHPRTIHLGTWKGMRVLLMTYLSTGWRQAGVARSVAEHIGDEITSRLGGEGAALSETPILARLEASAAAGAESVAGERILKAIEAIQGIWGDTTVVTSAWHGDLTPWNVGWQGQKANIWDWERFEVGVPHGLDVLHWSLATTVGTAGHSALSPTAVLAALPSQISLAVKAVYLLTMAERYVSGGDLGAARAEVMLDALDQLAARS